MAISPVSISAVYHPLVSAVRLWHLLGVLAVAAATVSCTVEMRGPVPAHVYGAAPAPPRPVYPAPPPASNQTPPNYGAPPPQAAAMPPPGSDVPPCIDPGNRDIPERYDAAMRLDPSSTTVGCTFEFDVDTFVVTVPPGAAGHVIHASVRGPLHVAPKLQVMDFNRHNLWMGAGPPSGEVKAWIHVAGGTAVYLRVSQVRWDKEPYILTLNTEQVNEPAEPNNDADHATPMHIGRPVTGFASTAANDPTSAQDWYRLEIGHDGDLRVDLDMSEGVRPQITVFDGNRHQVGSGWGNAGEHIHTSIRVHRGPHFLKVASDMAVSSAGQGDFPPRLQRPYQLTTDL